MIQKLIPSIGRKWEELFIMKEVNSKGAVEILIYTGEQEAIYESSRT